MSAFFPSKQKETADARIEKLAVLLTEYCTDVRRGQNIYLVANHTDAEPLYNAVRKNLIRRGANIFDHFADGGGNYLYPGIADPDFLRNASEETLDGSPSEIVKELEAADAFIVIEAGLIAAHQDIAPEKFSLVARAIQHVSEKAFRKRYVLCFFPTENYARFLGLSFDELQEIFYQGCFINRGEVEKRLARIKDLLDGANEVRIVADNTDLRFSLRGRVGIFENGKENLPGGEVYYAPEKSSAEGFISFSCPVIYFGKQMRDVFLEFRRGKVAFSQASAHQETLETIISTDEGSSFLGEFGIGGNHGIAKITGELLLDEVVDGTIHFALGDSYPECGGGNHSAIHFDLVHDMRRGGKILIDGKAVHKNGIWL